MPCKPDFASDLPLGRICSLVDRVHELETRESVSRLMLPASTQNIEVR